MLLLILRTFSVGPEFRLQSRILESLALQYSFSNIFATIKGFQKVQREVSYFPYVVRENEKSS